MELWELNPRSRPLIGKNSVLIQDSAFCERVVERCGFARKTLLPTCGFYQGCAPRNSMRESL
jgi:hypothetical protein